MKSEVSCVVYLVVLLYISKRIEEKCNFHLVQILSYLVYKKKNIYYPTLHQKRIYYPTIGRMCCVCCIVVYF